MLKHAMSDQMKPEFPTLEQVIFWYAYKRQKKIISPVHGCIYPNLNA